ncbi:DegT/DnrJ/EryC1/StrS family aminotransferase [Micromonospora sp. NPDC050686]|uniref:DegT/DnrJ/EryC1/StrS family aminotransferase n=1 Tax=Micromonospora sp. NPDC050686 TaxID=3154631 RepID=UPI003406C3C7
MKVPFLDLRAPYVELRTEIDAAYARVMQSGWHVLGPEVAAFEAEFAAYCGAAHCVTVGNGCDALELTLRALDIGPGDEVLVPAHTFVATWFAVTAVGARPVPVEPDEKTFTIDPGCAEAAVTSRTRAIIPVHLYGQPADLSSLRAVAARHGLAVVEDAAQAAGARHRGDRIGAGSSAVAFSFYPAKNLGAAGDSGAVVTDDAALADRLRLVRGYGAREKYRHEVIGTNSRTDELQAAILRVKLRRLDDWNARRATVAQRYLDELGGAGDLLLPAVASWAEHAWHLFVVRTGRRDELRGRLAAAGVETIIHYPTAVHRCAAYAELGWPPGAFPLAERLAAEVLSLPIGPHLSGEQAGAVISAVRRAC